ncbi:hypothetical protein BJX63DRAFT_431958 [Aspergillus granulosus]|uniref:Epidermal growth factor receptor-like transmembrane-juxtamembrane segment domain-containing protein n=1 Tax=Aspergillus granulosus TaxID=176169 RepID=A0ABR4HCZ5_9EURO
MAWCMVDGIPNTLYRTFTGTQLTMVPAGSTTTSVDNSETTSTFTRDTSPTPTETTLGTTTSSATSIHPSEIGSHQTDEPEPDDDSGTNVGAIAGGVVGGVAGLTLIILVVWFIMRRQKNKTAELREIGAGYAAPEPK